MAKVNQVAPAKNIVTIRELVDQFEKTKTELPALTCKHKGEYWNISYGEFQDYVQRMGTALLKMGYKKGDKIGLISENRNEWVLTYIAVTAVGLTIVPLDILLSGEELAHIIKAGDVGGIFTSKAYLEKTTEAMLNNKAVKKVILMDEDADELMNGINAQMKKGETPISVGNFESRMKEIEAEEFSKKIPFKDFPYIHFESIVRLGKSLMEKGENLYADAEVKVNDIAALIFTSGTTGLPKGVMLSHLNLMANADGVQMSTALSSDDHWSNILPMHHCYPSMIGMFVPLLTYGRITMIASLKPTVFVPIMKYVDTRNMPCVPALVEKMYKGVWAAVKKKGLLTTIIFRMMFSVSWLSRFVGLDLGKILFKSVRENLGVTNIRFMISGGGPIPKKVIDGMDTLGVYIMQGYGLTETSPVIATTTPMNNRPGSVGLKLVNVEVKIDDPDRFGNGEICARGPSIMQGYYKQPELNKEVIDEEGWLHTGDIGRIDGDGFIFITGRIKNIIVTKGGKNVYPEEIENMLLQSPLIAEAVIIGKSEPGNAGQSPYAVVYPNFEQISAIESKRGHELSNEQIHEMIKKEIRQMTHKMATYKIPVGFEISPEELPKTSSRKVKRFMFKG